MANLTNSTTFSLNGAAANLTGQRVTMSVYLVLLSLIALLAKTVWQPTFPKGAPKLVRGWPVFGAVQLYGKRRLAFLASGTSRSPTRSFSTYIGKYQVVVLSGAEARSFYFGSKMLDMNEGFSALFAGQLPNPQTTTKDDGPVEAFSTWFAQTIARLLRRENFVRNLPALVSDTTSALDQVVQRNGVHEASGVLDPYDDVYNTVYQLTMRTLGPSEIANDPELLAKTLRLFGDIERGASPMRIIFPWLPTVGWVRQVVAGARMYAILDKIVKRRKAEGRTEEDSLQFLMDTGANTKDILTFVIGSLFAGLVNSGINAAGLLVYLAHNQEWYRRVQSEVDAALHKHRSSPQQSPAEIFATLTIEDWESAFPSIELGLRESIRLSLPGSSYRRNVSGGALPIGNTGEAVPRGGFALYQVDEVHMDPAVYTNPTAFDPGRFLPDRAEDRKTPFGYLGWGAGRHPCLGMRFAKLEMSVIVALFAAMFDWELVDVHGGLLKEVPPLIDREKLMTHKPTQPVRLRYTVRQH